MKISSVVEEGGTATCWKLRKHFEELLLYAQLALLPLDISSCLQSGWDAAQDKQKAAQRTKEVTPGLGKHCAVTTLM